MLITRSELSASTADAALQFSVFALASASFTSARDRSDHLLSRCPSSRFWKFVSVSSLGFVALLATVQPLCSLTSQVLELYRLDEIVVRTKFLVHAIHFIALRQDVLQHNLAFWMLQSDSVFPSEMLSLQNQSLLVGMNAFLVFTLVMVSLVFFSHQWNASCCC